MSPPSPNTFGEYVPAPQAAIAGEKEFSASTESIRAEVETAMGARGGNLDAGATKAETDRAALKFGAFLEFDSTSEGSQAGVMAPEVALKGLDDFQLKLEESLGKALDVQTELVKGEM